MADGSPDEFWYCVKHHRVESGEDLCKIKHRLGPYKTHGEAERALETAQARNEAWEESDREWDAGSEAGDD
ncbi:hypothetical protein [Nocardioides acrostichi]|uniref:SPOR domain-containing protein n=1 Tax=Nocardioides acrostichi TaxID=2784339 RepID=A0A930UZD6_9ACTN|nr:hypothetical protein [Nocardioides acrostichi]MBF4160907.1 hypothetical protein [Nocardioides acrostichi]